MKAIKLKVHIGFPKTATTFFQEKCFGSISYLGKKSGQDEFRELLRSRFQELATKKVLHQDKMSIHRQTGQLVDDFIAFCERENCSEITMSSEGLTSWYDDNLSAKWPMHGFKNAIKRDPNRDPISLYLNEFFIPAWQQHGTLELITVMRNQSDFLASIYAQISYSISARSQRDFEYQFMRLIELEDPFLDYYSRITRLSECVGSKNLHVFFYETLFEEKNLNRFKLLMNSQKIVVMLNHT